MHAHRGFWMDFSNGVRISVQFGPGSYSSNEDYNLTSWGPIRRGEAWGADVVEVAVLALHEEEKCMAWLHEAPFRYLNMDHVAELITIASQVPEGTHAERKVWFLECMSHMGEERP